MTDKGYNVVVERLLSQANMLRVRKQWEEATDACVEVLRQDPGNSFAHSILGDIYFDQDELEDAAQWYRMAIDLNRNVATVDKLNRIEKELSRRLSDSATNPPGKVTASLDKEASRAYRSYQWLGIPTRRWLEGITAVATGYVVIVLTFLFFTQSARRANSVPLGSKVSRTSAPTADSGTKLPPIQPRRNVQLPSGVLPQQASSPHTPGSGLEQDSSDPTQTQPVQAPSIRNTPQFPNQQNQSPTGNPSPQQQLPPAPIGRVQPASPPPQEQTPPQPSPDSPNQQEPSNNPPAEGTDPIRR